MEPKTTLTIVYSPQYDGEVYLGDAPSEMGTLYLGMKGLMDFLSLRAGIHVDIKSDVEREADYMNAMNTYLDKKRRDKVFFEDAANVDPMGVAAKLLKWRDSLIMAGWNRTCDDASCLKLAALAEIESDFHSAGTADCWLELSQAYSGKDVLQGKVDKVIIDCTWIDIPAVIRHIFSAIETHGVELVKISCQQELDFKKVELVEFEDVDDAYEWIAQAELPKGTAIVNRDNIRLNHTLKTWNRPQVAASLMQSNPQLLQLFKLSMSIFSRPLNVQNLVSYLQLPMNPIPSDLRFSLVKILMDNGGFGDKMKREDGEDRDDWDETIVQYKFTDDKGEVSKTVKKNKLFFLKPIRSDYTEGVSKAELTDYIDKLVKWAYGFKGDKDMPEERVSQLNELISQLKSFSTTLVTQKDTLQYADIEQLVMQIYRPMNYKLQQPETGCLNVISDVRAMVKPAETLIWLDCQQEDTDTDPYDFLSTGERAYLKQNNVEIPDFAHHLENTHNEQIYKLNQARRVILVKSAYDGTVRMGEHSIVAELRYLSKNSLKKVNAEPCSAA